MGLKLGHWLWLIVLIMFQYASYFAGGSGGSSFVGIFLRNLVEYLTHHSYHTLCQNVVKKTTRKQSCAIQPRHSLFETLSLQTSKKQKTCFKKRPQKTLTHLENIKKDHEKYKNDPPRLACLCPAELPLRS